MEGGSSPELESTWIALGNLMAGLGMMDTMIPDNHPAKVGWIRRLEEIREWSGRQSHEISYFGDAFDEEDEEGEHPA